MSWQESQSPKFSFDLTPFNYPIFRVFRDLLYINIWRGCSVLHFGVGKNKVTIESIEYVTLDIDEVVKADYRNLNEVPENKKIDIVFSENNIEHLDVQEIKTFFAWCRAKKAIIVFNIPNAWASYGLYASDYTHKTFLNTRAYGGLLREAGYEKIEFYRINNGRFQFFRNLVSKFIGLDFCQTIGVVAK